MALTKVRRGIIESIDIIPCAEVYVLENLLDLYNAYMHYKEEAIINKSVLNFKEKNFLRCCVQYLKYIYKYYDNLLVDGSTKENALFLTLRKIEPIKVLIDNVDDSGELSKQLVEKIFII